MERHVPALATRLVVQTEVLRELAGRLLGLIAPVQETKLLAHEARAYAALGHVDGSDVPYLAAALAVQAHGIWSHDLAFDAQNLVPRIHWPDSVT